MNDRDRSRATLSTHDWEVPSAMHRSSHRDASEAPEALRRRSPRHSRSHRSRLWLAAGAVILAVSVLAACSSGPSRSQTATNLDPVTAGRQIFQDETDRVGDRIARTGGTGMMMPMMNAACASCHGTDGRGGSTPTAQAPDITYANLTDIRGMREVDGSRGHVYTDPLIRRAVIEGIGADGDSLSSAMPRWHLTDQEWTDLLAYLQTPQ